MYDVHLEDKLVCSPRKKIVVKLNQPILLFYLFLDDCYKLGNVVFAVATVLYYIVLCTL